MNFKIKYSSLTHLGSGEVFIGHCLALLARNVGQG